MFLTPAITPWESTVPGLGSVNPSVRLYHYCRDSGRILDYDQYYLNLTLANDMSEAVWELEYSLTKAFQVEDASAASLWRVIQSFTSRSSFDKYFRFNSVSQDLVSKCDDSCQIQHICAITKIDYEEYQKCLKMHTLEHFFGDVHSDQDDSNEDDGNDSDSSEHDNSNDDSNEDDHDNEHDRGDEGTNEPPVGCKAIKPSDNPALHVKNNALPVPALITIILLAVAICLVIITMGMMRACRTSKHRHDETVHYRLLPDEV